MQTDSIKPDLTVFRDQLFTGVIGQANPKKEFHFYLDSYQSTKVIPHLAIIAPKGQGKTKIARAVAKGLYEYDTEGNLKWGYYDLDANNQAVWISCDKDDKVAGKVIKPKKKTLVEINCASIKNLKAFINSVLVKYVVDKDVTVFFDEASELPHDVSMALLTILELNPTHRTQYAYDEYICDFDFRRQSFIFATTESQRVFSPLMDRMERITLQEYTHQDLADIVKINLPNVTIEQGLLLEISSTLRGNARAAHKMSEKILSYLRGNKIFSRQDWISLKNTLTIRPLGLNAVEVLVLDFLRQNPNGTSLTGMSAKTGMSREQLRLDSEMFLLRHNLMEITTTGRQITAQGIAYLKSLGEQNVSSKQLCATV